VLHAEKILPRVKAFVLLDLIGSKNSRSTATATATRPADRPVRKAGEAHRHRRAHVPVPDRAGDSNYYRQKNLPWGTTDDHMNFKNYGVPSVLLIDFHGRRSRTEGQQPIDPLRAVVAHRRRQPRRRWTRMRSRFAGNLVMQALPDLEAFVLGKQVRTMRAATMRRSTTIGRRRARRLPRRGSLRSTDGVAGAHPAADPVRRQDETRSTEGDAAAAAVRAPKASANARSRTCARWWRLRPAPHRARRAGRSNSTTSTASCSQHGLKPQRDTWTDRKELLTFTNLSVTIPGKPQGPHRARVPPRHQVHDRPPGSRTQLPLRRRQRRRQRRRPAAGAGAGAARASQREATIELVFFDGEESLDWTWNEAARALFGSKRFVKHHRDACCSAKSRASRRWCCSTWSAAPTCTSRRSSTRRRAAHDAVVGRGRAATRRRSSSAPRPPATTTSRSSTSASRRRPDRPQRQPALAQADRHDREHVAASLQNRRRRADDAARDRTHLRAGKD
jgi:hypothetical protein